MTDLSDVLTVAEAADLSGRAHSTIVSAIVSGNLAGRRIGGGPNRYLWITTRDEVISYVARMARRPKHPPIRRR